MRDAAAEFVRHWLLPLAQESDRSLGSQPSLVVEKSAAAPAAEKNAEPGSSFAFTANATRNIFGKITWKPRQHAWSLQLLKAETKVLKNAEFRRRPAVAWATVQADEGDRIPKGNRILERARSQ